jgi:hypothetical protein
MSMSVIYEDRYSIVGPPNGCRGPCNGMGFVPVQGIEADPVLYGRWLELEQRSPADDGRHFVICPVCEGS